MMKLNLFINANETESYIDIHAPKMNDNVQSIINAVNDLDKSHTLVGYIDKEIHIINVSDVITFQVINKNVTAITSKLKLRLYELEKQLPQHFIRISKSEIVNKYYIEKLLLEPNGLIRMYLKDAHYTYSSRRYLKSIKERLSI
ncbi:LytTR family DNA-binding domain-containing protein [Staphylococcus aureus]|nr:response regulator transcription factor [Staphylococcus aureus]EKV6570530.1 response regulator transcription factor [Staphylococcus aureus]EKW9246106.1 response regulator transcription factor [Staphylococcus aureus]EKW9252879.1 response regulator transcription factor [Staphylococcus aureus]